ncbi:MAG: alpha/beta hydrolase [Burkholderiaceae bacterium]
MNRVEVQGCGIEVLHLKAPEGAIARAPIVFLHEGLGSVAMWRGWPAQVCAATGRAGWVYSRRGYGASDPVPDVRGVPVHAAGQRKGRLQPDYMHREAFNVLPQLLARLGAEQEPVLLGHSDGASIALLHASRHGVTACIAMAPHVIVEDISVRAITQAREAFETGDLRERLARYHADVDCAFWQWNDIWLSPAFRSFDIRSDCRRIRAPLLAIQGQDDPYGTLQQIDDIRPDAAPVTRCMLAHCGHSPQRDQTAQTTQAVSDFLRDLA